MLTLNARVIVIAPWSTFRGRIGRVVQLEPYLAVLLDGEDKPLRMGDREGKQPGHGLCDFYLTTPGGEAAIADCEVIP